MTIPAYPLQWPTGWERTELQRRARAKFGKRTQSSYGSWKTRQELTIAQAVARVRGEFERMGVDDDDLVISTDLQLRLDGLPRSNQREPEDAGVAVYWRDAHGETRCMAIDRYDRVADNLAAVAATLDAMRAIERHGGAEILDRAFTGFTALPPPPASGTEHWSEVLDVPRDASRPQVDLAWRRLRAQLHPDRGGSVEAFQRAAAAYEQACRAIST